MKAQILSNGEKEEIKGGQAGKILKAKTHSHTEESMEIKKYLNTLQKLVPTIPKNKRLSNLEVISSVIDYIHDLRYTLGLPACEDVCDMESLMDDLFLSSQRSHKISSLNPNHHL